MEERQVRGVRRLRQLDRDDFHNNYDVAMTSQRIGVANARDRSSGARSSTPLLSIVHRRVTRSSNVRCWNGASIIDRFTRCRRRRVPFDSPVQLTHIVIIGGEQRQHPDKVKLYKGDGDDILDLEDCQDREETQEIELVFFTSQRCSE